MPPRRVILRSLPECSCCFHVPYPGSLPCAIPNPSCCQSAFKTPRSWEPLPVYHFVQYFPSLHRPENNLFLFCLRFHPIRACPDALTLSVLSWGHTPSHAAFEATAGLLGAFTARLLRTPCVFKQAAVLPTFSCWGHAGERSRTGFTLFLTLFPSQIISLGNWKGGFFKQYSPSPCPFFGRQKRGVEQLVRFPDCDPCSCKGQSRTAGTEPTPWELLVSVISHQYIQDICFSIPHPVFFCWEFKQEKSYSICLMYVNYHGNHRISCAQGVFLNSARSYSSVCLCSSVRFH